jgi:hypothetical protein
MWSIILPHPDRPNTAAHSPVRLLAPHKSERAFKRQHAPAGAYEPGVLAAACALAALMSAVGLDDPILTTT